MKRTSTNALKPAPGRSVDETTRLLTRTLTSPAALSASDRKWLKRRRVDLVMLWVELVFTIVCFALTILNILFMFIGLGLVLLAGVTVILSELTTGYYKHPHGATPADYSARGASDHILGDTLSSAQSKFMGRK
ncbi:hypothetical protein [Lacticaseibacillus absianus]|uniref:hypothetical protein n=1 Tax=Lacticaseibacillus absianus TaxID=2729623 RepID=UPI0015CD2400|nr:hypothetical protein [Lacticaseibacillus absianus]